jgi:transposase-like protein/IS1 family transposase
MTCPTCQLTCKKFGKDRHGYQRYRCRQCGRVFTEPHHDRLDGSYLPIKKAASILHLLVEGVSIRSIERLTDTHRDTILRLLVSVGDRCQRLLNDRLRGFQCEHLQLDEIWTFVWKKERRLSELERLNPDIGDQYVFVAIDAENKLVPSFVVGKRDGYTALQFMQDLQPRLMANGRIQLTTDGFGPYIDAIEQTFGADVDYAQLVKIYAAIDAGPGRYSPPRVSETVSTVIQGSPDPEHISTSYVERQNLSMRMSMRRFTRLTNAFSKKLTNLKAAVTLHFAHYNFLRVHSTLRVTPAMEAGLTDHLWTWEELLTYAL